jgi:hypothetical protein
MSFFNGSQIFLIARAVALSGALALPAAGLAGCQSATDVEEQPQLPGERSASTARSIVTVSADSVRIGERVTATLVARDSAGTDLATGGLAVNFMLSGGTSQGTFGPTVDAGDGTYQAEFTGTVAGESATIQATINGEAVTSPLPGIRVLSLSAPPGTAVCEAVAPARCWYVAADAPADGTGAFEEPFRRPQDAVERALPGDFIYLRGGAEFTHEHAIDGRIIGTDTRCCADGEPGRPITLKSYPGEEAVVRGRFENWGDFTIQLVRSHWRLEGLHLYATRIVVGVGSLCNQDASYCGPSVRGVWIVGNTLRDVVARWSNYGVIQIHGQPAGQTATVVHEHDPADIHIIGNTVRNVWAQPDQHGTRDPVPWYQDADPEHNACFAGLKWYRDVYVRDNDFGECPQIIYFKWESPGPLYLEGNTFGPANRFGRSRAADVRCNQNTLSGIQNAASYPYSAVCG